MNTTMNWTIVKEESDFDAILEKPNQFYCIVGRKGRIRVVCPVLNDKKQIEYFDAMNGLQGIFYRSDITAYAPLDIPKNVIKAVQENCKPTTVSRFLEIYPFPKED